MTEHQKLSLKAVLSTCVWREMDLPTAMSVARLVNDPKYGVEWSWSVALGDALISRARSEQATRFLLTPDSGEVLLFIDSDIIFKPEDAASIVKKCASGYDILGGVYVVRSADAPRPAQRFFPDTNIKIGSPDAEIIEAVYASTGFLAIHRRVFEKLAHLVPLCKTGNKSEMFPFFFAGAYNHDSSKLDISTGDGWEFLSEDWMFCQIARNAGFKVHLDPSFELGHVGVRPYWVSDINYDPLGTTYTVVTEGDNARFVIVKDYADHVGMTRPEAIEVVTKTDARTKLISEWDRKIKNSPNPKKVRKFHEESTKTLLDSVVIQSSAFWRDRLRIPLEATGRILDLGAGTGTYIIAKAGPGRYLSYVDPNRQMREFAKERFEKHKLNVNMYHYIDEVAEGENDDDKFDFVVATDVLQFLPKEELNHTLDVVYDLLKPNGSLLFTYEDYELDNPMLFHTAEEIRQILSESKLIGNEGRWIRPDDPTTTLKEVYNG